MNNIGICNLNLVQNTSPNVELTVSLSNGQKLLQQLFDSPSDPIVTFESNWDSLFLTVATTDDGYTLPVVKEQVSFNANGVGEVSVALAMTFVPASVLNFPVYRGIYVEKFIYRMDPLTGEAKGGPLQLVEVGETVVVSIQVTTPDALQVLVGHIAA